MYFWPLGNFSSGQDGVERRIFDQGLVWRYQLFAWYDWGKPCRNRQDGQLLGLISEPSDC